MAYCWQVLAGLVSTLPTVTLEIWTSRTSGGRMQTLIGHWRVITIEGDDCACGRATVREAIGEPGSEA